MRKRKRERERDRVGTAPRSKLALYERNGRPIRRAPGRADGSDSIDDVAIGRQADRQTGSYRDRMAVAAEPVCSRYIIVALRRASGGDAASAARRQPPRHLQC